MAASRPSGSVAAQGSSAAQASATFVILGEVGPGPASVIGGCFDRREALLADVG